MFCSISLYDVQFCLEFQPHFYNADAERRLILCISADRGGARHLHRQYLARQNFLDVVGGFEAMTGGEI